MKRSAANKNLHQIANVLLVANIFIWYLLAFGVIRQLLVNNGWDPSSQLSVPGEVLLVLGTNCSAIALSALLGSFLFGKFTKRSSFLFLWISIGVIVSLIPLALNTQDITSQLIISIMFGAYFGLGMPTTLSNFSASIGIEKRAKTAGITYLLIGLLTSMLIGNLFDSVVFACITLAIVRLIGLVPFRLLSKKVILIEGSALEPMSSHSKRTFLLYFVPWGIFCLVNYMTIPVIQKFFSPEAFTGFTEFSIVLENVIIAITAVIGGFLGDRLGRKRIIMVGFIMLGIGFAALGLLAGSSNSDSLTNPTIITNRIIAGYIYTVSDGVAWGIFNVIFLLTIWGDVAQKGMSGKFYAIGALPFVFANFMRLLLHDLLGGIESTQVFSFASIFLFLAILPLLYAPETLPEAVIKNRDLNSYVKKAMEKVQKESGRNRVEETKSSQAYDIIKEDPEKNSEYEEARKLAEKYY